MRALKCVSVPECDSFYTYTPHRRRLALIKILRIQFFHYLSSEINVGGAFNIMIDVVGVNHMRDCIKIST